MVGLTVEWFMSWEDNKDQRFVVDKHLRRFHLDKPLTRMMSRRQLGNCAVAVSDQERLLYPPDDSRGHE